MAYCTPFILAEANDHRITCLNFVHLISDHLPEHSHKLKVHLLLHLVDNMVDYGCCSCFSTERWISMQLHVIFLCLFRFEAENSFLRAQNIYSNRQAPSRDICNSFAVLNDLRHISSGGYIASGSRHRYSLILVTHTVTILKGVVMDWPNSS